MHLEIPRADYHTAPPKVVVIDPNRKKAEQREKGERTGRMLQRDLDLSGVHPPTADRPVVDVGSRVDIQQEIDALVSWAKHHPINVGCRANGGQ